MNERRVFISHSSADALEERLKVANLLRDQTTLTVAPWLADLTHADLSSTLFVFDDSPTILARSSDGNWMATGRKDGTVHVTRRDTHTDRSLEGHRGAIVDLAFSHDDALLATASRDGDIRLWRTSSWDLVAVLEKRFSEAGALSFNPKRSYLAVTNPAAGTIEVFDLDSEFFSDPSAGTHTIHYANAKVVLVGDSGVGKTALGLVLSGGPFEPTESTHGRHVWTFLRATVGRNEGGKETQEILLWDLAGQPGYRLIHQLSLSEITVALIVFDARSETDPFAGVRYWNRALRQSLNAADGGQPVRKFLIAARTDRGGVNVSRARIDALMRELTCDAYFEISAKEGRNVGELSKAIKAAIDWSRAPKVSSTELFHVIKSFLLSKKEQGTFLASVSDLYKSYLVTHNQQAAAESASQFETCIGRVGARGLIRRLSFGELVLLQPEYLDAYASAIVNTARDDPDGMGSIAEPDVREGRFRVPAQERLQDGSQERLLLIATIEELLQHELAIREEVNGTSYLILPSQFTREWPEAPDPPGKEAIFTFEGPTMNVYSTLAVRLSHCGLFTKKDMWKNAAVYNARDGGTCGIWLREFEEARSELTIFFDSEARPETKVHFEEYIRQHLAERVNPGSLTVRSLYLCAACGTPVSDIQASRRRQKGLEWISCNVCDEKISLKDRRQQLPESIESAVPSMNIAADAKTLLETVATIVEGKLAVGDFDVFLCHNSEDKPQVRKIAARLKAHGLLPWLDEEDLRPGLPWQREIESQIEHIKAAAIFVGPSGIGSGQEIEQDALLRHFVKTRRPVIPVLLEGCGDRPSLPMFLQGMMWVDFRRTEPEPFARLVWGITGRKPVSVNT